MRLLRPGARRCATHWVTEPTPVTTLRDEFVLQAYSLWLADPHEALADFREHEQAHSQQLADYEALLARLRREWGSALDQMNSPLFGSSITIHYGIGYEQHYVHWCRQVIEQLEQQLHGEQAAREEEPSSGPSSEQSSESMRGRCPGC